MKKNNFLPLEEAIRTRKKIKNIENIRKAYLYAEKAHQDQKRMTGEDYVTHPVAVAIKLLEIGADETTIIAALLHDTIEDSDSTGDELELEFGSNVANIVRSVTKVAKMRFLESPEDAKTDTFRKMFAGSIIDERAIIIKLADRAHNLETIETFRPSKQHRIAMETLDIYLPLAKLFGIWKIKQIFEQTCFPVIHPQCYENLSQDLIDFKKSGGAELEKINLELGTLCRSVCQSCESQLVYKTFYEMHEEHSEGICTLNNERKFHFNVVCQTIDDCYLVLGKFHKNFSWKESDFSDFISLPKNNGYQALHTTVFSKTGVPLEIHIKTESMELVNENGPFFYSPELFPKDSINSSLSAMDKNYYFSRQYIEDLKRDLLQKKIIVFTKRGESIPLPKGATGIDFAFVADHVEAESLSEIRVDGNFEPITTVLRHGQVVEAIPSHGSSPNVFWLNHTRTSVAKHYIARFLSRLPDEELIKRGNAAVKQELAKIKKRFQVSLTAGIRREIAKCYPEGDFNDVLKNVGKGTISPRDFVQKYLQIKDKIHEHSRFWRIWDSVASIFYRFFYFAYTSNVLDQNSSLIKLRIRAIDRPGMLFDILKVLTNKELNIASLKVFSLRPSRDALYKVDLEIQSYSQVCELFDELYQIYGIKKLLRS